VPGIKLSLVFDPDTLGPVATKLFDLSKVKTVKWGGKEHGNEYNFSMANSRGRTSKAELVAIHHQYNITSDADLREAARKLHGWAHYPHSPLPILP
jgi:hypothetical protein